MIKEKLALLTFIIGGVIGIVLTLLFANEFGGSKVDFPENCPEIDELCEEDFIRMCELTCPEILNINAICDDIFEARCEDVDCYCKA